VILTFEPEYEVSSFSLGIKCVVTTQVTYVKWSIKSRELAEDKESVRYAGSRGPVRRPSGRASGTKGGRAYTP